MSRSSPGVRRIVSILNFFADHPGQAFTLTDLVRALKLSRATCHGLLTGLVETGYLYRASDKSYLLGPALVSIGGVAQAHFSPLQAAQPEMRALADEFDAICSVTFRENGEVVVRDRAAAVSHLGYSAPRGTRLPLAPQFASLFFVWASPAEITAWLDGLTPAPSEEQRDAMRNGIEFLREHGFLFSVRNVRPEVDGATTDWLHEPDYRRGPVFPVFDLDPGATYHLGFVQAPVFDARRRVAFTIGLQSFNGDYTGAEVNRIGERVRAAAERISRIMAPASAA